MMARFSTKFSGVPRSQFNSLRIHKQHKDVFWSIIAIQQPTGNR